jgi:hypothetical protein
VGLFVVYEEVGFGFSFIKPSSFSKARRFYPSQQINAKSQSCCKKIFRLEILSKRTESPTLTTPAQPYNKKPLPPSQMLKKNNLYMILYTY